MTGFTVKIFPLIAVLISVVAGFFPQIFAPLGFLIVPLLGVIMLGMGASLSLADFAAAVGKPRYVVTGMLLQFLLMPLIAYVVGKVMHLPREQFIGLVMVGTVAGGTASNVITYLAGGDVALSITMTACSTAAGIVLTPLISRFYLGQTVPVPAWAMFKSILFVVALPVALGLVVNRFTRRVEWVRGKLCPLVSVTVIVLVIGIVVALNAGTLRSCGVLVVSAVILHNVCGLAAGYGCARLMRCDRRTAVTIAIEVGMQNSGLAAALSKQFFGIASALPGALFSVWHNLSGALFASLVRHWGGKDAKN